MSENIIFEENDLEKVCITEDIPEFDNELCDNTDAPPKTADEESKSDELSEPTDPSDTPTDTIESLRKELDALRIELEEKKTAFERMTSEINEFSELFPTISLTSIPDSVWQKVKSGLPIAAAYALYERKTMIIEADAKKVNEKNLSSSTGPIGKEPTSDFFSPSDVRAMSRDEVRKNYAKIMESMKKWN